MTSNLSSEELVADVREHFIPILVDETIIVKGKGAIVEDLQGNQYIDCFGGPGVLNSGHCHPKIMEAVKSQLDLLTQSPGQFINLPSVRYAKALSKVVPAGLKKFFFCNSGSESNDGAIKLALKHAVERGKKGFGIIALEHSFHGRLALTLSLTGMPGRKKGFGTYTAFPFIIHVSAPYCYRCSLQYPECNLKCVDAIKDAIQYRSQGDISILIAEPLLGVGGVIVPPPEYWPKVEDICKEHEITLIFDEVFTGFGRTGKMFASEHWGVVPDMMTMAKAIGGGFPLGAFIAREEVANSMEPGDHYTTFGINSLISSTAGMASFEVLKEENLIDNAAKVGEYLLNGLKEIQSKEENIGDVRGLGLFVGLEIVKDKQSKKLASTLTKRVKKQLMENGVLVSVTGNHGNVLRLTPPLVLSRDQADDVLESVQKAFYAVKGA